MSALREFLEDFGDAAPVTQQAGPVVNEAELESMRLAAFEEGYRAGWDDADKARTSESGALSEALTQKLQDLSFTYQEAFDAMTKAVSPLLEDVAQTLLPELAKATLGGHVTETLNSLAADIGTLDVQVAVASTHVDALTQLLDGSYPFALRVVADDSLSNEQADLRFGTVEKQIDLTDVIQSVRDAVQGFAHDNERMISNG